MPNTLQIEDLQEITFRSKSVNQTMQIAKKVGHHLPSEPTFIALIGSLGAGKTIFVKGLGQALGLSEERIVSPTFVLMNIYDTEPPLYHIDFYRLKNWLEVEQAGLTEAFDGGGIVVIEWADKFLEFLSQPVLLINIKILSENERMIFIKGSREYFQDLFNRLEDKY